jgi:hypothetical protein
MGDMDPLKSGKYTMQCDSDVSRVMFLRFYEAVEIDIYRKLTPRLHNIKVQLGECPAINSDMHVNVEGWHSELILNSMPLDKANRMTYRKTIASGLIIVVC